MARIQGGLQDYHDKRDFATTSEPKGRSRPDIPPPMFVVQRHDARRLHFDVRLEVDGVLKSWAVPRGPSLDPAVKRLAVMTEDHPLDYGDYEGVIPKGAYGGGTVLVWDHGRYAPLDAGHRPLDPDDPDTDVDALMRQGLEEGRLRFLLVGERLRGTWSLVRMEGRGEEAPWLLIKMRDEHAREAQDEDDLEASSALTGRTVDDLVAQEGTPAEVARRIARAKRRGVGKHDHPVPGEGRTGGDHR